MPATSAGLYYTFPTRRIVSGTNSPPTRLFPGMAPLNRHARKIKHSLVLKAQNNWTATESIGVFEKEEV
jgi:hypothetical protein